MNLRKLSTGLIFLASLAAGSSQAIALFDDARPADVPERPSLALAVMLVGAVAVRRQAERRA